VPANLYRCDLPLLRPLTTSQGVIEKRTVWVLELIGDDGVCGYGEASPLPGFGGEEAERCGQTLHKVISLLTPRVVGLWLDKERADAPLGVAIEPLLVHTPCARHAIEGALIDLLAKRKGVPVAALLADTSAVTIPVSALADDPQSARWAFEQGFETVKIKVSGTPEMAAARALKARASVGSQARLRIDANGAWDAAGALAFAEQVQLASLEFLEQPVPPGAPDQLAACAQVRRRTGLRISLDEGIRQAADVGLAASAQACDVVVLKPQFLGGWRPTKQAIDLARSCDLGVVLTSAIDGSIGRAFASHIAAACDLTKLAHGLATGDRLEADLTTEPLVPNAGRLLIRERPGLGIGTLCGS
jgi:o-succinylbenzoate synthase